MAKGDFLLQRECGRAIERFCPHSPEEELLSCLIDHQHENEMLHDKRCLTVLHQRQIMRNQDIRFNPQLYKACHMDAKKFCSKLIEHEPKDEFFEGKVIGCLREQHLKDKSRMTPPCREEIHKIIVEMSFDFREDPELADNCENEIKKYCKDRLPNDPEHMLDLKGSVLECLKEHQKEIQQENKECSTEVARVVEEGHDDLQADPLLHKACSYDLRKHCDGVEHGEGKLFSCLLDAHNDKGKRIMPACQRMLQNRIEVFQFAVKVKPIDGLSDLAAMALDSPAKNYFLIVFCSIVGMIFIGGLCCGRVTKRVTVDMKNR